MELPPHEELLADGAEKLFGIRPLVARRHGTFDGVQYVYKFDNGFGASVVKFSTQYGVGGSYGYENGYWELAVVIFDGEDDDDFTLTYDTPITDDVLGDLTEEQVSEVLNNIKNMMVYAL